MRPACLNVRMEMQFVPAEANIKLQHMEVSECCGG